MKRIILSILTIFVLSCFQFAHAAENLDFFMVTMDNYLTPDDYNITFLANNSGTEEITDFTVEWSINGGATNSYTFTGLQRSPSNSLYEYQIPTPLNIDSQNSYDIALWVSNINGVAISPQSGNQITHSIYGLSQTTEKKVLIEKLSATWCPNCPNATVVLEDLAAEYPENVIPAVVHKSSSDLSMPYSSDFENDLSVGYQPKGLLDRQEYPALTYVNSQSDIDFNSGVWESHLLRRLAYNKPVQLAANTTFDSSTRELTVDIDATFLAPLTGDYRFNAFIIENGIVSNQSGGGSNYVHDYIVRDMLGGVLGTDNSIAGTINDGSQFSHQYTYTVPSSYDADNMEVIVMVLKSGSTLLDKDILNSLEVGFNASAALDLETVSVVSCPGLPAAPGIDIFGNPVICPFESVLLGCPTSLPAGYSYQWQVNGADIAGATNSTFSADVAGDYSVYLTDGSGCNTENSTNIPITSGAPPSFNTSIDVNNLTVDFSAFVQGGIQGEQIYWAFGTGDSSFVFSPTYTFPSAGTYVVCVDVYNDCGSGGAICLLVEVGQSAKFSGKVYLEGPYDNNGTMDDALNQLVPTNHPYTGGNYNYAGAEFVTSVQSDVIDWILIEARTGSIGTSSPQTTLVERRAALLLADGTIADVNGTPGVGFNQLVFGESYYIVIRHRNHLDVISSTSIVADANMNYDFTTADTQAAGINQMKQMGDGSFALFAGDYNGDGTIQNTDADLWRLAPAINQTYSDTDGNLDRVVQNTDFDLWKLTGAKIGNVEIQF